MLIHFRFRNTIVQMVRDHNLPHWSVDSLSQTVRRFAFVALLAIQGFLLARSAYLDSYTTDEAAHLVAGVRFWQESRTDLYRVNPPLVKAIAAIPVVFEHPILDWSHFSADVGVRCEWRVGTDFLWANKDACFRFLAHARCTCIPLALLGTTFCYVWGSRLYGNAAGFAAACLWAFNPSVLGHGHLITTDVPAGSSGVLACFLYSRFIDKPTWRMSLLCGVALGCAILCKTIWIILFCLFPTLFLWRELRRCLPQKAWSLLWTRSGMLLVLLGISIFSINACYGFRGSLQSLGDYRFVSELFGGATSSKPSTFGRNRFEGSIVDYVKIPFPSDFVVGIDQQRADFEQCRRCFVGGEWYACGKWWFYFYALCVKEPVSTICLFLIVCTVSIRGVSRRCMDDEILLLLPALCVLLLACAQWKMTNHPRYLIAAYPFVFIWTSKLFGGSYVNSKGKYIVWALLVITAVIGVASSQSSLSYFNAIGGGSANGHRNLLDSGIDWGQDLLRLDEWRKEHPEAAGMRVQLAKHTVPGEFIGCQTVTDSANGLRKGWLAVSVNHLFDAQGSYQKIHNLKPIDKINNTIWIFYISDEVTLHTE